MTPHQVFDIVGIMFGLYCIIFNRKIVNMAIEKRKLFMKEKTIKKMESQKPFYRIIFVVYGISTIIFCTIDFFLSS